ncbi:hypothetical protein SDC9_77542 [bioreactor metagenome]|uniref:Uncharacterized protein n=1 Tax=bioreactor metagenome TaxID=1076179 RepID=A0A644YRP7_9ZZZZ
MVFTLSFTSPDFGSYLKVWMILPFVTINDKYSVSVFPQEKSSININPTITSFNVFSIFLFINTSFGIHYPITAFYINVRELSQFPYKYNNYSDIKIYQFKAIPLLIAKAFEGAR